MYGKSLKECTWEEVQEELLAQVGFEARDTVLGAHHDPNLQRVPDEVYQRGESTAYADWAAGPVDDDGYRWLNRGALCVLRPEAIVESIEPVTPIDNLFVAGDFLATPNSTPTMEKANEAGKLCASIILERLRRDYDSSRLDVPELPLGWLRRLESATASVNR